MSFSIPANLRRQVRNDAQGRCAYCLSSESMMGVTFELEHIIPLSAGGKAVFQNLCLSCPACNRYKGARLRAVDPITGIDVSLFHPRNQIWADHFRWEEGGVRIVGVTPAGRATVQALRMNRPIIVQLRRYWLALALHPPIDLS